jgi:hypothetical protein
MATVRLTLREVERGLMPNVCSLTGEPTKQRHLIPFTWMPIWLYFVGFVFCGGLLYFVLFMALAKRMNVELPILAEKKRALFIPKIVMILGILVGFITLVVGTAISESQTTIGPVLIGVGLLVILAGLVLGRIMLIKVVHPTEITADSITLGGVHENFAEALDEYREAKKEQARKRRAEEEAAEAAEEARRPIIKARKVEPKPPTVLRAKRAQPIDDEEEPPRRKRRRVDDDYDEDDDDRPRRRRRDDDD